MTLDGDVCVEQVLHQRHRPHLGVETHEEAALSQIAARSARRGHVVLQESWKPNRHIAHKTIVLDGLLDARRRVVGIYSLRCSPEHAQHEVVAVIIGSAFQTHHALYLGSATCPRSAVHRVAFRTVPQ